MCGALNSKSAQSTRIRMDGWVDGWVGECECGCADAHTSWHDSETYRGVWAGLATPAVGAGRRRFRGDRSTADCSTAGKTGSITLCETCVRGTWLRMPLVTVENHGCRNSGGERRVHYLGACSRNTSSGASRGESTTGRGTEGRRVPVEVAFISVQGKLLMGGPKAGPCRKNLNSGFENVSSPFLRYIHNRERHRQKKKAWWPLVRQGLLPRPRRDHSGGSARLVGLWPFLSPLCI